jgi:hypothetical protein
MLCTEFEVRLCEYLDGALEEALRPQVEQHASACAMCAAMLADSRALGGFLERVPAVEAPPELVTNILYRTQPGSAVWRAVTGGWRARLQPLLQPRFAMSMAMTVLSVSMLYRVTGVKVRQLEVADLNPVSIWQGVQSRVQPVWERGVKIYENVRFLYQIQSQVGSLTPAEEAETETPQPKKPVEEGSPEAARRRSPP